MKKLFVATQNRGKQKEIENCLKGVFELVLCAADYENYPEIDEDGETFEANALKKARIAARFTGLPSLADDSGLVVDALGGRPGVLSARYAGPGCDDDANNSKLLAELSGIRAEERRAAFVCAMAFVTQQGEEHVFSGRIGGRILEAGRGNDGFGYDPLFLVDRFGKTMAELTLEQKNSISHRGQALRLFCACLLNSHADSIAGEDR